MARVACALLLALLAAAPARADVRGELPGLLDEVTRAWAERQDPDGRFRDGLIGRSTGAYGNAMIGYAMLRAAERTGDVALREAGTAALGGSLRHWRPNGFEIWTAATTLGRVGAMQDELRGALEHQVATFDELSVSPAARTCIERRSCYSNLKLLDALTTLTALDLGLPAQPGGRMADRAGARAAARRMIEHRVPRVTDAGLVADGAFGNLRGSVLSDPSRNPLAYLAFSGWMMVRALDALGPGASPRAEEATRDALDAISALASPDGDLTYLGRGQAQVWVAAVMVAAGIEGAQRFAANPVRAGRYLGIAEIGLERLQRYRTGGTLRLVPGERDDMVGIDDYAGEVTYNGMALFALQHALDAAQEGLPAAPRLGTPAAIGDMRAVDDRATGLAVVRRGEVWFAVHERMTHPHDLRSDAGLLAVKLTGPGGWRDLLAPRPLTLGARDARFTGGPVLLRGGREAHPYGKRISASRAGVVTVRGVWRLPSGRALRRGVLARYSPLRDGVAVTVPARPGDRFRTGIFAPAGTARRLGRSVFTPQARITFSSMSDLHSRGGFHSAPVRDLDRIEVTGAPRSGGVFKIAVRAR
jgi:hypothetical protein